MRILIVEDQLVDEVGHHLPYLVSIVAGARAEDAEIEIASRAGSTKVVTSRLPVLPVLHDVSGLAGRGIGAIKTRWMRQIAMGANVVRNAMAIHRLLARRGPYDQVLCLTTALPQLATLALVQFSCRGRMQRMGALFVDYPKLGDQPNRRTRLLRWLIRAMGPNLSVLATTHYARRSWEQMLDMPVHYVVHPVEVPLVQSAAAEGCGDAVDRLVGVSVGGRQISDVHSSEVGVQMSESRRQGLEGKGSGEPVGQSFGVSGGERTSEEPATRYSPPVTTAKPLVFGFYGFARHEQGVDVLMQALEILHRGGELNAEFRILWPEPFRMPDGSWLDREQFRHLAPAVSFLEKSFTPDEYLRVLTASDWVVLPYRWQSYAGRISRISIEASVLGIPVIYTAGTDAEEVVSNYGSGIPIPDEDVGALAEAIRIATSNNRELKRGAMENRSKAREFFSGSCFIRQIGAL